MNQSKDIFLIILFLTQCMNTNSAISPFTLPKFLHNMLFLYAPMHVAPDSGPGIKRSSKVITTKSKSTGSNTNYTSVSRIKKPTSSTSTSTSSSKSSSSSTKKCPYAGTKKLTRSSKY